MRKKTIVLLSVGVILIVGIVYWLMAGKTMQQTIAYEEIAVGYSDISKFVTATGTIEPVTEVEVGTQVSGIIDRLYADYNSEVTKGQLIAEMDKVTLQSELASQQARYDGAKAEYEYLQKNHARNEELYAKQLISEVEYEQSLYNYRKAKSTFDECKAALAKAERNLSYATITSPINGVVISRNVEEGQTVASGFETPTLFTIAADLTQMQVVADVDEADIGEVREGQRVEFSVDAYPNDVFEGRVQQIRLGSTGTSSASSSSNSTVVTYEVVISAPNPELKLKPRLTANISIYTLDKTGVLSIPVRALRFSPVLPLVGKNAEIHDCESETKVWTREGNVFTAHPIQTGTSNGVMTEVLGGLEAGERVILNASIGKVNEKMNTEENRGNSTAQSPFMPPRPGSKKR